MFSYLARDKTTSHTEALLGAATFDEAWCRPRITRSRRQLPTERRAGARPSSRAGGPHEL